MSNRAHKKIQEGFTIIEVMIVLAIAGVIILMVFLAIPALQRNNRNTQIRNDVASVLGYVNEYSTNRNGALPKCIIARGNGDIVMNSETDCSAGNGDVVGTIRAGIAVKDDNAQVGDTGEINIALNYKCATDTGGDKTGQVQTTKTGRAFSALFKVETTSGSLDQCQDS